MTEESLDQARRHLDEAKLALEADLPVTAREHVRLAVRLAPDLTDVRLLEAQVAIRCGDGAAALRALDVLDHLHPDTRETPLRSLLRVEALAWAGRVELALRAAERMAEHLPDDARVHRVTAGLARRCGKNDRAAAALRQVVRLEPSNIPARRQLASVLAVTQPDGAIEQLEAVQQLEQGRPSRRLTELLRRVGRLADADEQYGRLLRQRPQDAALWLAWGTLADERGHLKAAEHRLREAVRLAKLAINPNATRAQSLAALAVALTHGGKLAAAGACWWRITRINHADQLAWAHLLASALACEHPRIVTRARRELEVHSCRAERRRMLARAWTMVAAGRLIARHTGGRVAGATSPTGSPLRMLLAHAAGSLQRHGGRFPRRADTFHHLAACREALRDTSGARAANAEALRLNPRYVAAQALADKLAAAA